MTLHSLCHRSIPEFYIIFSEYYMVRFNYISGFYSYGHPLTDTAEQEAQANIKVSKLWAHFIHKIIYGD